MQAWVTEQRALGRTIGFVPTMGALHQGHISLINRAKTSCDVVISSIFVNPTQFNNLEDLKKYPRTMTSDIEMLGASGCDVLFHPDVDEMYPKMEKGHWHFGLVSSTLEGHFRPGHFDGVLTVVKKLFEIVNPDRAFFGEKDYQQLALIRMMAKEEDLPIEIIGCPIIREKEGLAMSSRNMRLSSLQKEQSLLISRVLFEMVERSKRQTPAAVLAWGRKQFDSENAIKLEYLEIVDGAIFSPVSDWREHERIVILIAAYLGEIRLIDNVTI